MSPDLLTDLRELDPARTVDPMPPAGLLARLTSEPRPASRRPVVSRPRGLVAVGALAATAALVGAVVGSGGGAQLSLADQAYAQTAPEGGILHVVLTSRIESSDPLFGGNTGSAERWTYGDEAHVVLRERQQGKLFTYDQLLAADGSLSNRFEDGRVQTTPAGESKATGIAANIRRDVIAEFRRSYAQGTLDESSTTTFAGRTARRYLVAHPAGGGREEYYVDAETGAPLGSVTVAELSKVGPDSVVNGKIVATDPTSTVEVRTTTTIDRVERLPATPENLRLVRERG